MKVGQIGRKVGLFFSLYLLFSLVIVTAGINKNLTDATTPPLPYDTFLENINGGVDSVAVWVAPDVNDSLLFVTRKDVDSVRVINLATYAVVAELTGFDVPNGVAVDQVEGKVYVTDRRRTTEDGGIKKYDILDVVANGPGSTEPELFFGQVTGSSKQPMGVTVYYDDFGNSVIYATYLGSSTKYVRYYDTSGNQLGEWAFPGVPLESIDADSDMNVIYVADEVGAEIEVYTPNGTFVSSFGSLSSVVPSNAFFGEVEGIDVYECDGVDIEGYIIASDQKVDEFEIFDRETYAHLATFKVDETFDTDGLTINQVSLPNHPSGALFMQSSDRDVTAIKWENLAVATGMEVCLNGIFNPPEPDTEPPTQPSNLSAIGVSTSQIDLTWDASTDNVAVAGYRVFRDSVEVATTVGESYSDIGLLSDTTYIYQVQAFDTSDNNSTLSDPANGTTLAPDTEPPSQVVNLSAVAVSTSQIDLTWDAATDNVGVTGYNIYRDSVLVDTAVGLSYSDVGLAGDTTYSYEVSAFDAEGNEGVKSVVVQETTLAPDTEPPSQVVNLSAVAVSTSQIDLTWDAATDNVGVTGYNIYRDSVLVDTAVGLSYSDVGLASGTTYLYNVSAFDAEGNEGALSLGASATTEESLVNKVLTTPSTVLPYYVRNKKFGNGLDGIDIWIAPNVDDSLKFVSHKGDGKISVWDLNDNVVVENIPGFTEVQGVAVDQDLGVLYTADEGAQNLKKFYISDILAGNLAPALTFGTGFSESASPVGITVYHDSSGNSIIYATYLGSSTKYVRYFSDSGAFLGEWAVDNAVESIKADDANNLIYIEDDSNWQIEVFTPSGVFVTDFGASTSTVPGDLSSRVEGIDIYECGSDGYILAFDQGPNEFEVYDRLTFDYLGKFSVDKIFSSDGFAVLQTGTTNYVDGGIFATSSNRDLVSVQYSEVSTATAMTTCLL